MFDYELILSDDGTLSLTQGGEVMWTSDNCDDFAEEWDEVVEAGDLDDVIDWLREHGEIPPEVAVNVLDESTGEEWIDDGAEDDEDE